MKSKSFLSKILALIVSIVCLVGVLSGCSLVKTNMRKDNNLIVAKIQIEEEVEPIKIYKKDLYSAYVSYGYYYVNYYGYTMEDTYEMIISNYQQNAVVEQFARIELSTLYNEIKTQTEGLSEFEVYFKANVGATINSEELNPNSDIDLFLTEYQISEATYNVKLSINSLIDSLVEKDEEEKPEKETVGLTERANPFVEEEKEELNEWELKTEVPTEEDVKIAAKKLDVEVSEIPADKQATTYDLNKYVFDTYNFDVSTKERSKALNKAIANYRSLGIVGTKEFFASENALEYSYFKDQLNNEKVQLLVLSYQDSLVEEVEAEMTPESLYADYSTLYENQKAEYSTDYEAYEKVLNALKEDTLLVYNPYENYGFVSNLLIGFSDEQAAELKSFQAKEGVKVSEVEEFRNTLAKSLVAKDQRISWATSGKGTYNQTDSKYEFDSKYFLSEENGTLRNALSSFIGSVSNPISSTEEDDNGLEQTIWTVSNGYSSSIKFENLYNDYLLDSEVGFTASFADAFFASNGTGINKIADYTTNKQKYDNAMKDLIYAFSTDPGSLTAYKGYMYSPFTSKTTYVPEFADAAKALINAGVGSYTMVVTDYGIHVMVCTEVINPTTAKIDQTKFINYIKGLTTDLTAEEIAFIDNFKKVKQDTLVEDYVSQKANSFVSKYLEEDSTATTFYKDNYKDLV